eukprot:gene1113-1707_t
MSPQAAKLPVFIDVLLKAGAPVANGDMKGLVKELASKMLTSFAPGKEVPLSAPGRSCRELQEMVRRVTVDDRLREEVPSERVSDVLVRMVRLQRDSSFIEGTEGDAFFDQSPGQSDGSETAACEVTPLPHESLVDLWESLFYDDDTLSPTAGAAPQAGLSAHPQWCGPVKEFLLQYCETGLLFSDYGVNPATITWNRVLLFHGPPGTGKTSLCKALAQKLSVMLSHRYAASQLVEINTHSLFSKWFSESGKLVLKLFTRVREMAEDTSCLVIVLIDEVESLAAARKASLNSSEPSDAIRVVNALLTQLDALRRYPNILTFCTSNITDAIDIAFVDRADVKLYIGNPGHKARHSIIATAVNELLARGMLTGSELAHYASSDENSRAVDALLGNLDGTSGRFLRKLPFLAFSSMPRSAMAFEPTTVARFVAAMTATAEKEKRDKQNLGC